MKTKETIGLKISPILIEIENALWEFEAEMETPPYFPTEGFRAATKIFMACLMDKIYEHQKVFNTEEEMAVNVEEVGISIRKLIKSTTGIDMHDLYKTKL